MCWLGNARCGCRLGIHKGLMHGDAGVSFDRNSGFTAKNRSEESLMGAILEIHASIAAIQDK